MVKRISRPEDIPDHLPEHKKILLRTALGSGLNVAVIGLRDLKQMAEPPREEPDVPSKEEKDKKAE